MADRPEIVTPLFPLGMVAVPGEVVPLHIFEPRYRAMVADCLEQDMSFAIVAAGEEGVEPIGCTMAVTEVLERFDDGRLNILTQGRLPVRVVEEIHDRPYPAAIVEVLDDTDELPDGEAARRTRDAYAELVLEASERAIDPEDLALMSAYEMAATVELGPEIKQQLLVLRSEIARMRLLGRILLAALKRLDYLERAEVRASSNGVVRFG
ncbi:unannotated protein [freshwater metagenome]|uniref:Unannotated protein n=1 Tax=freshwater metagenome TaxID=449393 RepID=A0A6J7IX57_9ZZZZ|nr:peptidase S16 [Actinomycetota bacterium]